MELNNQQKKALRKELNHTDAKWQIGKGGLTDNFIANLSDYLEKHEIAKVKLLQNFDGDKKEIATAIMRKTGAMVVQIVGKQIMLFKEVKGGDITVMVKRLK